jgi:transcriptional regulator with XRE-family HTH domain
MFRNFGPTLTLLREMRGKSQAEVARRAGIGKSQQSKYESGTELPKLGTLEKVLAALDVRPVDLFAMLEMVDRRAESLNDESEHPLAWLHGASELCSDLLPEGTTQAFRKVMDDILALHRAVLAETVFSCRRKKEAHHARPALTE